MADFVLDLGTHESNGLNRAKTHRVMPLVTPLCS